MPKRIQLRRTKGWRMPENTISVARPTMWGNPFHIHPWEASRAFDEQELRAGAAACFRMFIEDGLDGFDPEHLAMCPDATESLRHNMLSALPKIKGLDLACWCPLDHDCHADVLLELANTTSQERKS